MFQCKTTDFPYTLNSIDLHHEYQSGNFHTSGLFTVNHDSENAISWKPLNTGRFKILIKQPELFELQTAKDTFDLEVGIFDVDSSQILMTEVNHSADIGYLGE